MSDDGIYDEAVAEAQKSGLMSGSIATDRCQCPACGEVFTTEGNFDRHLVPGRTADDFDGSWCQPPATVGLIQRGRAGWHQPGPDTAAWEGRSASDRESGSAAEASDGPPGGRCGSSG